MNAVLVEIDWRPNRKHERNHVNPLSAAKCAEFLSKIAQLRESRFTPEPSRVDEFRRMLK